MKQTCNGDTQLKVHRKKKAAPLLEKFLQLKSELFKVDRPFGVVNTRRWANWSYTSGKIQMDREFAMYRREIFEGNLIALQELAYMGSQAAKLLEEAALEDPEFVSLLAQSQQTWPVNAFLSKSQFKFSYDYLSTIKLDLWPSWVAPKAKLELRASPAKVWAWEIWSTMLQGSSVLSRIPVQNAVNLTWFLHSFLEKFGRRMLDLDDDLREILGKLPPLTLSSIDSHWWPLAQKILLRWSAGEPWTLPGLEVYSRTSRVKGRKKDASTKRAEVLKQIKPAFRQFAKDFLKTLGEQQLRESMYSL